MSKGFRIDELLERLDIDGRRSNHEKGDWFAFCPIYPETKASLHITRSEDDPEIGIIYRFGHDDKEYYAEFLEWWDSGQSAVKKKSPVTILKDGKPVDLKISARQWFTEYTNTHHSAWQFWGVEFTEREIIFTFDDSPYRKIRTAGSKTFRWEPSGEPPPIWPSLPEKLPERIYLFEGETDTGVARGVGFEASFGLTKGAKTPVLPSMWKLLQSKGVREIVILFNSDKTGIEAAQTIAGDIRKYSSILPIVYDIWSITRPDLGEKDLRDVHLRQGDPELLYEQIKSLGRPSESDELIQIEDFLSMDVRSGRWIVDKIWLFQTIGMISGDPRIGKTWLALDLGLSVATGTPFLNTFEVKETGPVIYVGREDPDYLLRDRLAKIMIAKGLGSTIQSTEKGFDITFQLRKDIPFFLDLSRDFVFTPEAVDSLIGRIRPIADEYGPPFLCELDPILRMIEGDEFKASEVGAIVFTNAAERLRNELGTGVVLIHHHPHGARRAYGSMAFRAFSENTLRILSKEPDKDGWAVVETDFKSEGSSKFSYRFPELKTRYEVEVDLKATEEKKASNVELLVSFLRTHPWKTRKELEIGLKIDYQAVKRALKVIEEEYGLDERTRPPGEEGGRPATEYALSQDETDDE